MVSTQWFQSVVVDCLSITLCSLNSIHYYRLTKNQVVNSVDEIHSSKGATRACLLLKLHVITYIIKNKWKNGFNFSAII